ncbi:MAG: 3'(2'),5'-bisphosphate nucleotidase CysQ [Planctomycetota bacterium]
MDHRPTDEEIARDLEFAATAAREAGERVLALRRSGRWTGSVLADIGDQAADSLLQGYLRGRYPDDGVLSEETADSWDRLGRERTWIVDPLDGTREFSELREDWSVHVALTIGSRCALGAVALPVRGDVLWGVALPGRERAGTRSGAALCRGDSAPRTPPRVVVSRSHTPPWVERFATAMGAELLPCGSAGYKVSLLLRGEADVYVHKAGLKEWDTCAPETVARALGWHVGRLHGEAHRYNQRDPRNHELVVCRPAMREAVTAHLRAAGAID